MPIYKKDILFDLITSLTKAEKRNFRIYSKKIAQQGEVLFLQLFDYLEKQAAFDLATLLKNQPHLKKSQIPNLKRNLYQHILSSLRLLYSNKKIDLKIREFLDDAEILYSKGLYLQALKILGRAKKIATKNHQNILLLEIITFESRIESRHITRSSTERMTELMQESAKTNQMIRQASQLANLKLYLQRYFINHGPLKNAKAQQELQIVFQQKIAGLNQQQFSFSEKVFYYQSIYWYHFLLQDFSNCHTATQKWMQLFEEHPTMKSIDLDMYLRAMHHVLNTAFFIKNGPFLSEKVGQFEQFIQAYKATFGLNAYVQAHLFLYQAQFNHFFLKQDFKAGLALVPTVLKFLKDFDYQLDNYKIMILQYKIAACYFGNQQPAKTVDFLNEIIYYSGVALREDILLYSRLLLLAAHYDLENTSVLEYVLNSTDRQLHHMKNPDQLSRSTVTFFKKLGKVVPREEPQLFRAFKQELLALQQLPTERRAFIFLDLSQWVDHKLGE